MSNPVLTIDAIKERCVYGDDYRSRNGMPYLDSDIRTLLSVNEQLVEKMREITSRDLTFEEWENRREEIRALIVEV